MQHAVIDGADFGIPTAVLKDKMDIFEIPVEMIEQRPLPEPAITVTMKKPENSGQAAAAAKAEITNIGVLFKYDGETYTVPKADDWDLDIFEAQEEGRLVVAVKLLLGPEQWKKFKSKKRRLSDLDGITNAAEAAIGFKPGE